MTRALNIGMNDYSRKVFELYFIAPIFKLYVSEAEEIKIGLADVLLTVADKASLRLCGTEIIPVEITLGIKHLTVVDNSGFALVALNSEFNVARKILAEVNNGFALGCDYNFLCGKSFLLNNPFALTVKENFIVVREGYSLHRLFINKVRVVSIAVVKVG